MTGAAIVAAAVLEVVAKTGMRAEPLLDDKEHDTDRNSSAWNCTPDWPIHLPWFRGSSLGST